MTKTERDELRAKYNKMLMEQQATMIAKEEANEAHLFDNLSEEDEGYLTFGDSDNEDECYMGLSDQAKKPKVNSQSVLSSLSDNDSTNEKEDLFEAMSWEDIKQQMEDYANLASMFNELVKDNAKLVIRTRSSN